MPEHTRTIRLEVTTEVIEGIALGDKITATVVGEVTQLEAERTFEDFGSDGQDKTFPPEITLELSSVKIRKPSQIDVLMEDDDDDAEEIMGRG